MEWEMQEMFNKKLNQKLKKIKEFSLAESQKLEDEKQKWQQQKEEMSQSRKNFEFEKNDFNNFTQRAYVNKMNKLVSLPVAFAKKVQFDLEYEKQSR